MNNKTVSFPLIVSIIVLGGILSSCHTNINTVGDQHFEKDGTLIVDSQGDSVRFLPLVPNRIKFYVEVSGSMNGFFRANAPTQFKADVWRVLTYFSPIANNVTILTNDGSMGQSVPLPNFQTQMNTGAFVSSASTKVPLMIQSITQNLNLNKGEVAVLISDLKYSPVGAAAPQVLLTQYSTDISEILGKFGKAVSLVGATSDYLDKGGNVLTKKSPYYFLILGNPQEVAYIRNGISTLLENNGSFIDNIESGFNFGAPTYSFGIPDNCYQMNDEDPTFVDFDPGSSDTCIVKLNVNLENYRWAVAQEDVFKEAFKCKPLYGSNISIGTIGFDVQNITGEEKQLERKAIATVELKVYDMAMESEVIEWSLQLPDLDITKFSPYLNAKDENDVTKSYSLEDFIKGMFYGGVINKPLKSNYILISQNS